MLKLYTWPTGNHGIPEFTGILWFRLGFNQRLSVGLWYADSARDGALDCFLWCSDDGRAPAERGIGGDDEDDGSSELSPELIESIVSTGMNDGRSNLSRIWSSSR